MPAFGLTAIGQKIGTGALRPLDDERGDIKGVAHGDHKYRYIVFKDGEEVFKGTSWEVAIEFDKTIAYVQNAFANKRKFAKFYRLDRELNHE